MLAKDVTYALQLQFGSLFTGSLRFCLFAGIALASLLFLVSFWKVAGLRPVYTCSFYWDSTIDFYLLEDEKE